MRSANLQEMTVSELVERFVALGIGQFNAELRSEQSKLNRLLLQMRDVTEELKNRPGDQRSALVELLENPNVQVRLMAARLTLAVAPAAARQVLQDIRDSKRYPQAMDAGMWLRNFDTGVSKPT